MVPEAGRPRKLRLSYTLGGKTVFFLSESSNGLVAGVGEVAPPDARRFHLTAIKGERGLQSHITDQTGIDPTQSVPPPSKARQIRRIKRLFESTRKYRSNEVAWVPVGEFANELQAILVPVNAGRRAVIPLERMRKRVVFDFRDPAKLRKVKLRELAETGKAGLRLEDGRLYLIIATKDGIRLRLTIRQANSFLSLALEAGGLGLDAYLAHIDARWPPMKRKLKKFKSDTFAR